PGQPVAVPGPALVKAVTAPAAGPHAATPVITAADPAHGRLSVRFSTGSGEVTSGFPQPTLATLTIGAGPPLRGLAGTAPRAFLPAPSRHLGSTISVLIQGEPVSVRMTGEVTRFPTITGPSGGLIVDQAALQDMLMQAGIQPVPDNEWWLRD